MVNGKRMKDGVGRDWNRSSSISRRTSRTARQLLTSTCWRHTISVDAWQCNYENYATVNSSSPLIPFFYDLKRGIIVLSLSGKLG